MRAALSAIILLAALAAFARDPIEGEWQVNGDGPLLVFRQASDSRIDIVWAGSAQGNAEAGDIVGYALPAPESGVYDCVGLDPRSAKGRKSSKQKNTEFVIRLDRDYGHTLTFEPYRRSTTVDVYRLLPWWLRLRVKTTDTRPKGLDGARRTDAPPAYIVL